MCAALKQKWAVDEKVIQIRVQSLYNMVFSSVVVALISLLTLKERQTQNICRLTNYNLHKYFILNCGHSIDCDLLLGGPRHITDAVSASVIGQIFAFEGTIDRANSKRAAMHGLSILAWEQYS